MALQKVCIKYFSFNVSLLISNHGCLPKLSVERKKEVTGVVFFCIICNASSLQSKHSILLCIIQNDGAVAVLVFAHTCTPPVLDVGGCTDSVSATGDCNATTNVPGSSSAK